MTTLEIFENCRKIQRLMKCAYFPEVGGHIMVGVHIYKINNMILDADADIVYTHVEKAK